MIELTPEMDRLLHDADSKVAGAEFAERVQHTDAANMLWKEAARLYYRASMLMSGDQDG